MKAAQKILKTKKKVIYGTDAVLREVKAKTLTSVFTSSNYPADMFVKFEELKDSCNFELERLNEDSEELGALLRKTFLVSVIGIKK